MNMIRRGSSQGHHHYNYRTRYESYYECLQPDYSFESRGKSGGRKRPRKLPIIRPWSRFILEKAVMLKISHINTFYGKIQALWDVSLTSKKGLSMPWSVLTARGKTTLLKTISGWLHPASGTIEFLDKRIDRLPAPSIVEMGLAYIPEGGRLFPDMTVRENFGNGSL